MFSNGGTLIQNLFFFPGHNRLPTTPLAEITFRKHVINKAVPAKKKKRKLVHGPQPHGQDMADFAGKMARDAPDLLWNRYREGSPAPLQNASCVADTEDLLSKKCLLLCDEYFKRGGPLTAAERLEVCERTVGQSDNPE